MSNSVSRASYPPAAVAGQSWNHHKAIWGLSFLVSLLAYFAALQGANYLSGFAPFGGLAAFLLGVPIGALVFKFVFIRATGGIQPTVVQGALAVALAVGLPLFNLAEPLTLAIDDAAPAGLLIIVALGLLAANVAWGVLAMHLWRKSV